MLHEAHERSPRTALTPIPETSGLPQETSDLDDAMAPRPIVSTADEGAERAAKRAAVKRELPAWRSVKEFPDNREASGRLSLRASESADPEAEGVRAVCRVRDGALTLGLEQRAASGERTEKVVAEVPKEARCVRLLVPATLKHPNLVNQHAC